MTAHERDEPLERDGPQGGETGKELTVLLVPQDGRQTRGLQLPYAQVRALVVAAGLLGLLLALLVGSWVYLAARTHRTAELEERVEALLEERSRVEDLARSLVEVETAYERLRSLFGPDLPGARPWLPPPTGRPPLPPAPLDEPEALPTSWPLTERGFLTQPLMEGADREADHPGIDIAVASGSYIRAAGPGTVAESGEDPVYGLYLVLDHGGGYRSRYAHASVLLPETGDRVGRHEVVGLTGSTGRSTAPHLHFEIVKDGEPVDPLSLVQRP